MRFLICSFLLAGCSTVPTDPMFAAPPVVGSALVTDHNDVRCESRVGARYTAETGFFHADCSPVKATGQVEWRVIGREYEALDEGGFWLLRSRNAEGEETWLVLPWHDWV